MNKKLNFALGLMLTSSVFCFYACNNEEETDFNENKSKSIRLVKKSTKKIAYNLAQAISKNPDIVRDIHRGINEVCSYGLDENLSIFDIVNTSESKFILKSGFSTLQRSFNDSYLMKEGFYSTDHYNNLNIYWGYHDKWDGKATPIICYVDTNTTEKITGGYRIYNGEIQEVLVDEKMFDSAKQPIIVINFNDVNYEDYPNFKKGEVLAKGVSWANECTNKKFSINNTKGVSDGINWASGDSIYTMTLNSAKSGGHQYDPWWNGGSEFRLTVVFVNPVTHQADTSIHTFEFTRDQISNKKNIYLSDLSLNPDWRPEYGSMLVRLVETDAGSDINIPVSFSIDDVSVSVTINIKEGDHDDKLGQITWLRPTYINQQYGTTYLSAYNMANKIRSYRHAETFGGSEGITLTTDLTVTKRPY